MKQIKLSNKFNGEDIYITVDDWNYEWLNQWKWSANIIGGRIKSVRRDTTESGKRITFNIGRFIFGYYGPLTIDHIDRNPLNNLEENLRIATPSQQCFNKDKWPGTKNKYKGVKKIENRYEVSAGYKGKHYYLGSSKSEEGAALMYNKFAEEHYGEFAVLNKIDK